MRGGLQAKPGREERMGLGSLLRETKLKNEETELGTDQGSGRDGRRRNGGHSCEVAMETR